MNEFTVTPKIKIVHVQLLPLLSGVQRVTLDELMRLDRQRYEPWLICQKAGPLTEAAEKEGIRCIYVPELVREISTKNDSKALIALTQLFRKYRFDVVHTHSSKTGVLGRVAGKLAKVPVVMHSVHGFAFPAAKSKLEYSIFLAMEWIGARCSDAMVFLNDTDQSIARTQLQANEDMLHLLPNGVDTFKFSPLPAGWRSMLRRSLLDVDSDTPCVVMLGRLWRQKNPECFVEAAIKLLNTGQQAHFFMLGDGEYRDSLQRRINEAGYGSEIHLLGWRTDVPRLLNAMDLFVLPSRWEGMPLAILEAQAIGLPVVASDIPGNRDLVHDGTDGLLCKSDDVDSLAEKLATLLSDKNLRLKYGEAGRKKVLNSYRIEARVDQMSTLYYEWLKQKSFKVPRLQHYFSMNAKRHNTASHARHI